MTLRALCLLLLAGSLSIHCGPTRRTDGGSGPLTAGAQVPDLTAEDHRDQPVALRSMGQPALVYFYPRDGTPGCTKEACALRDAWNAYTRAGVSVIGVSSDSKQSHQEFAEEHTLPFSLVADPDHVWCKAFGVTSLAGFDKRTSFLIDAQGKVVKVYPDVDPGVHAAQVLEDARALGLAK